MTDRLDLPASPSFDLRDNLRAQLIDAVSSGTLAVQAARDVLAMRERLLDLAALLEPLRPLIDTASREGAEDPYDVELWPDTAAALIKLGQQLTQAWALVGHLDSRDLVTPA